MIIIDQDKNKIINFDNVNEISITETGEVLVVNNTYITNDCLDVLGKYDTEKRAKEVLEEIIKAYLDCNEKNVLAVYAYVKNKVYEMPTE